MSINVWGSNDPAQVAKGGTGRATLDADEALLGSGTGAVTSSGTATDGELLIGATGADPAWDTPSGTTNEITVTGGSGTLTLAIADDPTFPGTGAVQIPVGTDAQQPSASDGMMRYNSTDGGYEVVQNSAWVPLTTAASGAWTFLSSSVFTGGSATSIEFDDTYINSSYYLYAVSWSNLVTSGSGDEFICELETSGTPVTTGYASSYINTGAANYVSSSFTCAPIVTGPGWGWFYLFTPADSGEFTSYTGYTGHIDSGTVDEWRVGGVYPTATAHDGIVFSIANGDTIASVNLYLWGLAL